MRIYSYLLICTVVLFTACSNDPIKNVDVGDTKIDYKSERFDREIFGADFSDPARAGQQLYHKYGRFYCDYMEAILRLAPCQPDSNFGAMEGFVQDPYMSSVEDRILLKFPDIAIAAFDEEFKESLTRWHYFFPDSIVPRVVYMHSGLNFSAFSTDSTIAVGLDFYLGPDDSLVKLFPNEIFPKYIKDDMRPDYLVCNAMKDFCWFQYNKINRNTMKSELLDILIEMGKEFYLLDALLPEVADEVKMNWSPEQLEWAKENEVAVWKELADQKILFGTKYTDNRKWIDIGPFTNVGNIPQDSPSQLGIWMGWNMVRANMKANPNVTLQQLLLERDSKKILSAYKPDRN